MKKLPSPTRISLFLIIGFVLAFFSVAFGSGSANYISPTHTPLSIALTPIPTEIDVEEVGSTDGITVLAILITLIISLPVLGHWVLWMKNNRTLDIRPKT